MAHTGMFVVYARKGTTWSFDSTHVNKCEATHYCEENWLRRDWDEVHVCQVVAEGFPPSKVRWVPEQ